MEEASTSRFYAVKTTGGQEKVVADFVKTRAEVNKKPIYSILVVDGIKGYAFFEAPNAQVVGECIAGFKHAKSLVQGVIPFKDVERFLVVKPVITEIGIGDVVEVIAGPFREMKAKVTRIEEARSEVTITLLDAPYPFPVTVDANYLKIIEKAKEAA